MVSSLAMERDLRTDAINAAWDFHTFNVDRDVKAADSKMAPILNATDPDLRAFKEHGGKIILYHGWSDAAIPTGYAINYYQSIQSKMGASSAADFVRLYMVSGRQHCSEGPGADKFGQSFSPTWTSDPQRNARTVLENWVEKETAPGVIIASKTEGADPVTVGSVVMTRPLCP